MKNTIFKVFSISILLLFILKASLFAQFKHQFDHLTSKDGLLDDMVYSIFQDSKGYIWIGGKAGLQRYDGYNFLNFTYNPKKPEQGLQEMVIRHIMEASDGTIWVGTQGGGIARVKNGNLLPPLNYNLSEGNGLMGSFVEDIIEDTKTGGMWIATLNGLIYYNNGKFTSYQKSIGDPQSLSDNRVFCLKEDDNGRLWVGTQNGLNLHLGDGKFQHFTHNPNDPSSIGGNFVHDIVEDGKGNIWLAIVQGGLSKMNLSSYKSVCFMHDPANPKSISGNMVLNLAIDTDGNLWAATFGSGLNKYHNGEFERFQHNPLDRSSILNNSVEEVMVDNSGNVWTANHLGGVNRYAKQQLVKRYLHANNKEKETLPTSTIRALLEASDSSIWVGVSSGGLTRFKNEKSYQFPIDPIGPNGLVSLRITSILEDSKKRIWIANFEGSVDMIENGKVTHFSFDKHDTTKLQEDEIIALAEDNDGNIWLGSSYKGIYIYNNKKFTNIKHDPSKENTLSSNHINNLFYASDGAMWIATEEGLCVYDHGVFKTYKNIIGDLSSLPKNKITVVVVDAKNNVWIGFDGGIAMLKRSSGKFITFDEKSGIPAGSIVEDLCVDANGHVWVATHNGASRFDYDLNQFKKFTSKDGYNNNAIIRMYSSKKSRKVYFGGPDGIYYLKVDDIHKSVSPSKLHITDFNLIGEHSDSVNMALKERLAKKEHLNLRNDQNSFNINYAVLSNEIHPNHNYSYRLKNLSDDWIFAGNETKVTYTYLEPGDYVFEVKLLGTDRIDSIQSISFTIQIQWWKSLWFRALIVLSLILVGVLYYKIYFKQIRLNKMNRVLEEKVLQRTAELDRFIYKSAHDLQGPISTMLGLCNLGTKSLNQKESKLYFEKMNLTTQTFHKTLTTLGRTYEIKNKKIILENISFSKLINNIIKKNTLSIDMTKFEININIDKNLSIKTDKYLIKLHLKNLLDNAFLYTSDKVDINYIEVQLKKIDSKFYKIIVIDNGQQIPNSDKDIFKMFYRGSIKSNGPGLGLYESKIIVERLSGKMKLDYLDDLKKAFITTLPIN